MFVKGNGILFIDTRYIILFQIQEAQQEANEAKSQAQMAYDEATKAKNQTEKAKLTLQSLLTDVEDFLGLGKATPEDVKNVTKCG